MNRNFSVVTAVLINFASLFSQVPQSVTYQTVATVQADKGSSTTETSFTFKIIVAADNTFGYDIFQNNRMVIHQPIIPGTSGAHGFKTKSDAEKVAQLVMQKMKNGERRPTVTSEELNKIGIK